MLVYSLLSVYCHIICIREHIHFQSILYSSAIFFCWRRAVSSYQTMYEFFSVNLENTSMERVSRTYTMWFSVQMMNENR